MKKSMFTILCGLTLSLFASTSNAQSFGSNQALMEAGGPFITTFSNTDKAAIGTPYLNEEFTSARISIGTDMLYKVRYNAFNDEFEVKITEDNIQSLNKDVDDLTITIIKGNETFGAINFTDEKLGLQRGYFMFLTKQENTTKLYIKKEVKYMAAKPAVTGYDRDKPAEFKNASDTYYISINNAYAQVLPKNKKDIAKLFPDNTKDVLNFIKSNKIKTSRQNDLIKLVDYISTL